MTWDDVWKILSVVVPLFGSFTVMFLTLHRSTVKAVKEVADVRVDAVKEVAGVKEVLSGMEERLSGVERGMAEVKSDVGEVKSAVTRIQGFLEGRLGTHDLPKEK